MLLFWNPRCGFCQAMLGDLKIWDDDRRMEELDLLVISSGTVEENRKMDLRSPILIDQGLKVASMFGAGGTPMAVMLDAAGSVASPLASGAEQVFALARLRPGNMSLS